MKVQTRKRGDIKLDVELDEAMEQLAKNEIDKVSFGTTDDSTHRLILRSDGTWEFWTPERLRELADRITIV